MSAIQAFNQAFAQSPELRQQIREVASVPQLLALLQTWGFSLTGPEIMILAQQAYQTWLVALDPTVRPFFVAAREDRALNQALESCQNPDAVIRLAQSRGFELSLADLQAAANAANQIEGFSLEKVWFKSLGLLA